MAARNPAACNNLRDLYLSNSIRPTYFNDITRHLLAANGDSEKNYRDSAGNTSFHFLASRLWTPTSFTCSLRSYDIDEAACIFDCIVELLDFGFDPTVANTSGETVLHVVLKGARCFRLHDATTFTIITSAQCLIPFFAGCRMQDAQLLCDLYSLIHQTDVPVDEWVNTYIMIVTNNVIDADFMVDSGKTPLHWYLGGNRENYSVTSPPLTCLCSLLGHLCKLLAYMGCNLQSCISEISCTDMETSHAAFAMRADTVRYNRVHYTPTGVHYSKGATYPRQLCECSYLAVLDILLEYGCDISPLILRETQFSTTIRLMGNVLHPEIPSRTVYPLSIPPTPHQISHFCAKLITYFPGCTREMVVKLINSCRDVTPHASIPIASVRQYEINLIDCSYFHKPKPLKFLAKLTILRATQRRNIELLPLPTALRKYVQIVETLPEIYGG